MLDAIANLPFDTALDVLAEASKPLRPIAPGESAVIGTRALGVLVEVCQNLHLGNSRIRAIEERNFEALPSSDAAAILESLTQNMTSLTLEGVDKGEVRRRLSEQGFVRFSSLDNPRILERISSSVKQYGVLQLALTAFAAFFLVLLVAQMDGIRHVEGGSTAILASQKEQAVLIQRMLAVSSEKKSDSEESHARIEKELLDLKTLLQKQSNKSKPILPKKVIPQIKCGGGTISFDAPSRDLTFGFPGMKDYEAVRITVIGKTRTGAHLSASRYQVGDNHARWLTIREARTDFVTIDAIGVEWPSGKISHCDAAALNAAAAIP
jgi:hypothetical protein